MTILESFKSNEKPATFFLQIQRKKEQRKQVLEKVEGSTTEK